MDQPPLRRTASAPHLEMSSPAWDLAPETINPASTSYPVSDVPTSAAEANLLGLHNQLAANFHQLSIAIEKIKALEAQLASDKGTRTKTAAKLERKLAGHLEHRDSLGTQRRRLLGKTDRAELSRKQDG
ncbi:hypothetical protein MMC26_000367 [Xylographa opegraphella]|nr:hypothetical protein [Xylographa opegraphella]